MIENMIEHKHTWVYSPGRQWRTCKFCGEFQQFDSKNWQPKGKASITCS